MVIGLVVTYGRPRTFAHIQDLEIVPPQLIGTSEEVDIDAVMTRRPRVVLVDEMAHANGHRKRWQDIELLLEAGIDVISTLNIEHLESLNDVVAQITGVTQAETIPDDVVRRADQIELVDMSPEALRRRMAHGNIYPPEAVDTALGNYFRVGNLSALRELALLWVADRVEDSLQAYMGDHRITQAWETRERVVVALTGAAGSGHLVRRAARMAHRSQGDLLGVHIQADGRGPSAADRTLLEQLGGKFHEVAGPDVAEALIGFATAHHATQLVMGTSRRSRWTEITQGSVINDVIRQAGRLDVHVISNDEGDSPRVGGHRFPLRAIHTRHRTLAGLVIALLTMAPLTALLAHNSALLAHGQGSVTSGAGFLVYFCVVVIVAAIGGLVPALVTVLAAALAVDFYLIPPYGSFAIARGADAIWLVVFVVLAAAVSALIEQAARSRLQALRARDEANTVMALTERLVQTNPPQAVVDEIRTTLGRQAVTLLRQRGDEWDPEVSAGLPVATGPDDGERYDLRNGQVLVMTGPPLRGDQHRLVAALVSYLEAVVLTQQLQSQASAAAELSQANGLRTALLAAVSHDLRTPLASIKAVVTGLLEPDVRWSHADTTDFLITIDEEADRLNKLVENLLDMSRLQTGALHLSYRDVGLDEIVPSALASLSRLSHNVIIDVPETLPRVRVDPALVERAVANVIDNAIRHSPHTIPVRVEAGAVAGRVDLRIVDRGCGIPMAERSQLFRPFQRLGDTGTGSGVGLGLAVSRGFVDAVGGELSVEDTPGGGVTMVISFPALPAEPVGLAIAVSRS
jgi:two-component system sensor histidine kinase KdpD